MITTIALALVALLSSPPATDACEVPEPEPTVTLTDGTWLVGTEAEPGTYRTVIEPGGNPFCRWERTSGLSGTRDDRIASNILDIEGTWYFEVQPSDVAVIIEHIGGEPCVWELVDL